MVVCPTVHSPLQDCPLRSVLHDSTALVFCLLIVRHGSCGHVFAAVRCPVGGSGRLPPLHVLALLADAGQRSYMKDVSDAVLRLQWGTLQVGGAQLLGCVGALGEETGPGQSALWWWLWNHWSGFFFYPQAISKTCEIVLFLFFFPKKYLFWQGYTSVHCSGHCAWRVKNTISSKCFFLGGGFHSFFFQLKQ